jgi:hypothetical protein
MCGGGDTGWKSQPPNAEISNLKFQIPNKAERAERERQNGKPQRKKLET